VRPSSSRRFLIVAAAFLVPLLVAEAAINVLIATHRLPYADAHRDDFEITWANLERREPVDVLILGDSTAQQGVEPRVLEELVVEATGRDVAAFNIASPGAGLGLNAAIVQQLADEDRLPPLLVVAVYAGTLSTDATFEDIFSRTVMGRLVSTCNEPASVEVMIDCHLSRVSAMWRWRGHPDDVLEALMTPLPTTERRDGLRLRADGFREGRGRPISHLEEQLGRADLSRRLFDFPPAVSRSWTRLVEAARAEGSTVIGVAMPDTPQLRDRMEELQPGRERMYRDAVAALAEASGVPFVVVEQFGDWFGDGMARNFNHLSREGARHFTRQLWQEPLFRQSLLDALDD
jgi:hypothetical protein